MSIQNILFVDIKTAPQYDKYEALPPAWKELWPLRAHSIVSRDLGETVDSAYRFAGLYPEYGKIICITLAYGNQLANGKWSISRMTLSDTDERALLEVFCQHVQGNPNWQLCGYDSFEFVFPYLRYRLKALKMAIPAVLDIRGKQADAVSPLLDARRMWKEGSFTADLDLTSLDQLTAVEAMEDAQVPSYKASMGRATGMAMRPGM